KRTETSRRSAAGATLGASACSDGEASAFNGVPHSPQNLFSGAFSLPHERHTAPSRLPQSPQNFCSAALLLPQFGQGRMNKAYFDLSNPHRTSVSGNVASAAKRSGRYGERSTVGARPR